MQNQLQKQDLYVRQRASGMLQGAEGPKNISEVLAVAGIERDRDMRKLAASAIRPLFETAPGLSMQAGVRVSGISRISI